MKKIYFVLFSAIMAVSSFAQERIILDRDTISINSDSATLVRTKDTPNKIKIIMQVPMSDSVCENWQTRPQTITSGIRCGYRTERNYIPMQTQVCTTRNPYNNICIRTETRTTYTYSTRSYPRTCTVIETYCAQYGVIRTTESDGVVIKFKKASNLIDGQEETFSIRAYQGRVDGNNVKYDLSVEKALKNYSIKGVGFLGSDSFTIKGN